MRTVSFVLAAWLAAAVASPTFAGDEPAAAVDEEAAYARALEQRADAVLGVLALDDPAKAARVREAIINQYRGLRKLHDARDAAIKVLQARPAPDEAGTAQQVEAERARADAASSALNDQFLAALAADLSPEQVEAVKDKMTYNKLQVTYNAYLAILPDLTAEQKRVIFDMLREARDRATYAGSSEEKSAVFNKYKGRVNNYLAAQGYDLKRAEKQAAERRNQGRD